MRWLCASLRVFHWLRPSLADVFLASLVAWLFVAGQGWTGLLADGDTGWHIRTGEWILEARAVPTRDLFSFSLAGSPWFAWEWLSDVIFALAVRCWGLAGVAALAGGVIALAALALFRHVLWRGANALVALAVLLLAVGASSIHYLARPHVFTLFLFAVSLGMLERDRRQPSTVTWLLIPVSVVWVNLHSGFFALPASAAVLAAGCALEAWLDGERRREGLFACARYATLSAATLAASLVNPYGIGLHRHIARYLSSDWIRNMVDEFASPRFRSENSLQFELLLLTVLLAAGTLIARRRLAEALLILFWAHLALGSVRHVPLFAIVAAPTLAAEISRLWQKRARAWRARSVGRILCSFGEELAPGFRRVSLWAVPLSAAVVLLTPASKWPRDFPEAKFPVSLVQSESTRLRGARVFTSDQWGDYLIYRGWPIQKVFIDGRSDFYGPSVGGEYLALSAGRCDWEKLMQKYDIGVVLAPKDWPLTTLLDRDPRWRRVREDKLSVLFERPSEPAPPAPNATAMLRRY